MKWFNNEKEIKDMTAREEMQLELQTVEKEIAWYDLKVKQDEDMFSLNAQQKLNLLKKKWVIQTGLKNNLF